MMSPGPQDYLQVNLDNFKKRTTVIPQFKFTKSLRTNKSFENLQSKSPGPLTYRPKSAMVLSTSPKATFGND